jgi:hypothetical protein
MCDGNYHGFNLCVAHFKGSTKCEQIVLNKICIHDLWFYYKYEIIQVYVYAIYVNPNKQYFVTNFKAFKFWLN